MDTPETPFETLQSLHREARACKIATGLLVMSSIGSLVVGVASESERYVGTGLGLALGSVFAALWSYENRCKFNDLISSYAEQITGPVDE